MASSPPLRVTAASRPVRARVRRAPTVARPISPPRTIAARTDPYPHLAIVRSTASSADRRSPGIERATRRAGRDHEISEGRFARPGVPQKTLLPGAGARCPDEPPRRRASQIAADRGVVRHAPRFAIGETRAVMRASQRFLPAAREWCARARVTMPRSSRRHARGQITTNRTGDLVSITSRSRLRGVARRWGESTAGGRGVRCAGQRRSQHCVERGSRGGGRSARRRRRIPWYS